MSDEVPATTYDHEHEFSTEMDVASISPAPLAGVWHRLFEQSPPLDGGGGGAQDRTTTVLWTQSPCGLYVDLRLPAGHPGRPDTATTRRRVAPRPGALAAAGYSARAKEILLSREDADDDDHRLLYEAVLRQQSFAGRLIVTRGDATTTSHRGVAVAADPVLRQLSAAASQQQEQPQEGEEGEPPFLPPLFTCHWQRSVDCQPPATRLDVGVCAPQRPLVATDGSVLLMRETGDDAGYAEDWLLLPSSSTSDDDDFRMAATLVTEDGIPRRGFWIRTASRRFAMAIGYPVVTADDGGDDVPARAAAQVSQQAATEGQTLETLLPELMRREQSPEDGDDDDENSSRREAGRILDVLGSYVAVAGTVVDRGGKGGRGDVRDWKIQYSTHAELVGCSLLIEGEDEDEDDDVNSTVCSRIEHRDATDTLIQRVPLEDGTVLERVWKVESSSSQADPFSPPPPTTPRRRICYGMDAHPDFVNVDMPRTWTLPSFGLTPLSPDRVREDYEAVVESTDVLRGLLGDDWPVGLTIDDDRIDLSWHEREFTLQRSFSWIVRAPATNGRDEDDDDEDRPYLGCAYLFPEQGRRGRAKVVTWIRAQRADRLTLLDKLNQELKEWLDQKLSGLNITLEW